MAVFHPVVKKYTRLFGFCVDIVHYTYLVSYGTFFLGLFDNICNVVGSTEHYNTLLNDKFFSNLSTLPFHVPITSRKFLIEVETDSHRIYQQIKTNKALKDL